MIERLPYEHDSPEMRRGKSLGAVSSVLPVVFSRAMVELDLMIRAGRDECFADCIGPANFTPAQDPYAHVRWIADVRSHNYADEICIQVEAHSRDAWSYVLENLSGRALDSLLLMLQKMIGLLRFYGSETHERRLMELQEIHVQWIGYLEDVASVAKGGPAKVIHSCVEAITKSARSVSLNEAITPELRESYVAILTDGAKGIEAALLPA